MPDHLNETTEHASTLYKTAPERLFYNPTYRACGILPGHPSEVPYIRADLAPQWKPIAEIPKGWEECEPFDATHCIFPDGTQYEAHKTRIQELSIDGYKERSYLLHIDWLPVLGITPIRKVEVEPIEFRVEVDTVLESAAGHGIIQVGRTGWHCPREWIGKRFREVIE